MNTNRLVRADERGVLPEVEGEAIAQRRGLVVFARPAGRADAEGGVREGTTGRIVSAMPMVGSRAKVFVVPRVWAVADPELAPEVDAVPVGMLVVLPAPALDQDARSSAQAEVEPKSELAFYRKYTEAMLRRYLRLSTEAGRVPSLLGRELFRGNVTSYRVHSFEDVVIFCHDMEGLLAKLRPMDQELIKRIALQQYSQGQTASMMRINFRTCKRMYGRALDVLTEMLLEGKMLEPLKSCQGGKSVGIAPSNSFQ